MSVLKHAFTLLMIPVAVTFIGVFSSTARGAELQKPALKQGYYFSLIPVGEAVLVDSSENFGPWPSVGGQFRMGEELNRWFDLGLSGGATVAYSDNYRLIHGHFGLDGTFKPTAVLSIGLQAGLGFGDFTRRKPGITEVIGRFGATYGITVSYDLFAGSRHRSPHQSGGFAMSPYIGAHIGPSDVTSIYAFFVGIAFTRWTGLPKNRLDLPLDEAF
ncbi:MAG: hypothetical protein JXX29_01730 [Deltaproteobacteria bacterium]|nr:hypothetical protein [Deltaproteobacteria bacterium]MBN2670360.1 hypothetical protein [Deltaproteobacteria bacterium]